MSGASRRAKALVVGLALTVVSLAGCGASAVTVNKSTATFAEQPGAAPNYIFPLASLKYFSVANLTQFQFLMYRPLYWFGENGQVKLNPQLSIANPPTFSSDGKAVTVTLKQWVWSDGQPITSRDVEFWQNLVTANKLNWAAYSPGEYPDNVISTTINSPTSITFNLSRAYGTYFFTYNELSQITPLPQHLWDKEAVTGSVGDFDKTPAGAVAVFKFLDQQSGMISTYDTNPLWRVVSGPWKLKHMDTSGNVKMVPNNAYSGPVKPKLTEFDEIPFAKDTSEYNQLKASTSVASTAVDYGYLPFQDVPQKNALSSIYTFVPWSGWLITYFPENFTNPRSGPIFKQLYFRQAMQDLVDQTTFIKRAYFGFAYPTHGPVPLKPATNFADQVEQANPYPYSPKAAVSLLQQNGWTVNPNGISTCASPGTGAGQCGAGVGAGAQASFKLEYASGLPALDAEMAQLKSDFALAGIELNLSTAPFNTVVGNSVPCVAGQACTWDMECWGGGWIYSPDYYPTGDEIFSTGAGSNSGGFSDPMNDQLTLASEVSNDVSALHAYEDYLATALPVVWLPTIYSQLSEVNTHLQGTQPQDPLLQIYPENWSWS